MNGELEDMRRPDRNPRSGVLSLRQLDVLRLIAAGAVTHQISVQLGITPATVSTHAMHILHRLGAQNRAHAVALGLTSGVLEADTPHSPIDGDSDAVEPKSAGRGEQARLEL
jgi:DNA-binding CsgD family transcriptional regulator